MRALIYIFSCTGLLFLIACNGDSATETAVTPPPPTEESTTKKTKIQKAPVTINPSQEQEYPQVVRDLGFPIHPNAEIAMMGNTIIDDEGLLMRLNVADKIEEAMDYYQKQLTLEYGWREEEMKIYQGADKAMLFKKDNIDCRLIAIQEADHTKVMISMNKAPDISKYQ